MPAPTETYGDFGRWVIAALLLHGVAHSPRVALAQPAPSAPASTSAGAMTSPSTSPSSLSPRSPQQPHPTQPSQWPSPDDMERALQGRPMPTPERLATHPQRGAPNIPPDPTRPAAAGTIDIAAMARQGAALATLPPAASGTTALRIFITLDMPRPSLQRLVEQSERSGATLVLRGLKAQSMRQTLAAAGELIGNRRVSWVIDPNAFLRYKVSAAPTFVLVLAGDPVPAIPGTAGTPTLPRCSGIGCTTPASQAEYLSISGDVSLDYALEAMLRHSVDAAPHASAILQRLRKP